MAPPKTLKKWTVMIYLAGDNNLSSEMIYSLKEMKRVKNIGPAHSVIVLALFDPSQGLPTQSYIVVSRDEDNQLMDEATPVATVIGQTAKGERSAILTQNPEPGAVTEPFNTGAPDTLFQFIRNGIIDFPAEHYMVVLSGHGSGADEDFLLNDNSSRDSLTIPELKCVFTRLKEEFPGQTIDVLGLDSCLMSMAEVYYELANIEKPTSPSNNLIQNSAKKPAKIRSDTTGLGNTVNFLVGAEGFEPSSGWPYQRILSVLARKPDITPEECVKKIVKTYTHYYADYTLSGLSVDLAACDLRNGVPHYLKESMKQLAIVLGQFVEVDEGIKDAILLAHWEAQSYKFDQYTDLYDFCGLLSRRCDNDTVNAACHKVMAAIRPDLQANDNAEGIIAGLSVVLESDYTGPAFQFSHGLSIYFPWNRVSEAYQSLDFARGTGWGNFLRQYVNATRRPSRNFPCPFEQGTIKNRVFAQVADEVSVQFDDGEPVGLKYTAPADKYTAPADKGLSYKARSMKNPPIAWCPNNVKKRRKP